MNATGRRTLVILGGGSVWLAAALNFGAQETLGSSQTPEIDPRLRSAFLVRQHARPASTVATDVPNGDVLLRRHFDVVLDLLGDSTSRSIEIALVRLEAARAERWSEAARRRWRTRLASNRRSQIARLRAYRDRGIFPRNEGHAPHAVPIFVDTHGTACAVGHLMRLSGWESEVAEIADASNLVFVTDVQDGPLVEWVLTSGLTHEEAALIQPGYEPPPIHATLSELLVPGAVLERDGVRYTDFEMVTQNFELQGAALCEIEPALCAFDLHTQRPPLVPIADGPPLPDPATIRLAAHSGVYSDPTSVGAEIGTNASHWLYVEGLDLGEPGFGGQPPSFRAQQLSLRYRVSTTLPDSLINRAHVTVTPFYGGGGFVFEAFSGLSVVSRFSAANDELGTVELVEDDDFAFFLAGSQETALTPQRSILVEADLLAIGQSRLGSVIWEFNVVPEPTCHTILLVCVFTLLAIRRDSGVHGRLHSSERKSAMDCLRS